MLSVIIYDSAKSSLMRLSAMLKAIMEDESLDSDIRFVTLNRRGVFKAPIEQNEPCLFIMEFHIDDVPLYQKISELYTASSVLFFADTLNEAMLRASLSGNIRPSGFIEKPFSYRELRGVFLDVYAGYANSIQNDRDIVSVAAGGRLFRYSLKNIIYFEAFDKKINLVTKGQCVSYYDSLGNLEKLYSDSFVRCHKSYLANTGRISEARFGDMLLVMDNGAKVPISRTYKNNVKEALCLIPKSAHVVSNS